MKLLSCYELTYYKIPNENNERLCIKQIHNKNNCQNVFSVGDNYNIPKYLQMRLGMYRGHN